MLEDFPTVQSGGSLILAWQVKNKPVLMVGGGEVAAGRILNCLNADAIITVVAPSSGLHPEVAYRIRTCPTTVKHIDRTFAVSDLDTVPAPSLVLCAVDDPAASTEVFLECHKRRIPANIADVPPECDFYFGSTYRDGPLQIMVSTNGKGPRMAALVRKWIGSRLPSNIGEAVGRVGVLRRKLRSVAPDAADGPKRMKWMSSVCDKWSLEELCTMNDTDMDDLLKSYVTNNVPSLKALRGEEEYDFDGSFGWWI